MRKILLFYLIFQLVVAPAYAATDFVSALKTSGGDFSNVALWEAYTDVDLSLCWVCVTVDFGDDAEGDFPVTTDVNTSEDDTGHSARIVAPFNDSSHILLYDAEGDVVAGDTTWYKEGQTGVTFTCSSMDTPGGIWLEIYGTNWDISQSFAGASNTSASLHRGLIGNSFTANGTPHINYTGGTNYSLSASEAYFVIRNLNVTATVNNAGDLNVIYIANNNVLIDGVSVHDATNSGAGTANGITGAALDNYLVYRSIVEGCDGDGISLNAGSAKTVGVICSTAKGNGGYGFTAGSGGTVFAWSNYGEDNTGGDFLISTNWDAPSGYNASKDATYALGIGATGAQVDLNLDADGLAQDTTNMSGASYGRNPYDDVTASYTFSNFLWNGATGSSYSEIDILGDARPTPHSADVQWHVGADQYLGGATVLPQVIINAW